MKSCRKMHFVFGEEGTGCLESRVCSWLLVFSSSASAWNHPRATIQKDDCSYTKSYQVRKKAGLHTWLLCIRNLHTLTRSNMISNILVSLTIYLMRNSYNDHFGRNHAITWLGTLTVWKRNFVVPTKQRIPMV